MPKYSVGQGVTVTEGPLQGIYGFVVMFDEKQRKYLIRFNGTQQMFYDEEHIVLWE